MNFFERGRELQVEAITPQQALACFKTSCQICTTRGLSKRPCGQCSIRNAHLLAIDAFKINRGCRKQVAATKE
jgi:hypothetical protein